MSRVLRPLALSAARWVDGLELPSDKANHLFYGAGVAAVVLLVWVGLMSVMSAPPWVLQLGPPVAQVVAGLVGVLKEVMDYRYNKFEVEAGRPPLYEVSPGDVLATVLGGTLVSLPAALMGHLVLAAAGYV